MAHLYLYAGATREAVALNEGTTQLQKAFPTLPWEEGSEYSLERTGDGFALDSHEGRTTIDPGRMVQLGGSRIWLASVGEGSSIIELSTAKDSVWVSGIPGTGITVGEWGGTPQEQGFRIERNPDGTSQWMLVLLANFYVDGTLHYAQERIPASRGIELAVSSQSLKLWPEEIHFSGCVPQTQLPVRKSSRYTIAEDFPEYRRSPRLILRDPEDEVSFVPPQAKPKAPTGGLLKMILPSLAGVAATIGMSVAMGRGWLTLLTAGATLITMIFTITQYFSNKKKYREDVAQREEDYDAYLQEKVSQIWKFNRTQRDAAEYHYPSIEQISTMVEGVDSRIYEKTPQHFDFLTYRLGLGTVPASVKINYESKADQKHDDVAKKAQDAYDELSELKNMPIVGDLMHGVVGYVGQRNLVIEQLQLMMLQVSTFQSYHDLEFIVVFPEEEKQEWLWSRWLKHTQLHDVNLRGFVYNQRSRDHVLSSLNTILKDRKNALAEAGRQQPVFLPHLVIMVTDQKLIMDHVIMEFLQEDPSALGVSLIFVEDVMSSLRENVKTVIDIRDSHVGNLVMQEGVVKNTEFELDHFPQGFSKEIMARNLGGLRHQLNLKSSIPDRLNFLEMYGVETVDQLDIARRWAEGKPRKTMAVPIGWRAQDDIVYLNLHEKADGPHGLLAGTTGSGKTEVVKDLITSLAVNFRPDHVAFLPIDFKGGALANDLKPLPHTVGAITNLDAASANRALASIQAEMRRRQSLFTIAGVSNINDYHTELEAGKDLEPMPHLVMVSDEFAELKAQMPDFLDQLVSVARVGRSLGVHLILATQKPAGVVNDQIWANSKFKIALKVADAADSKEILKTPDAADITQTGRGYLQVGNNEKYELFQTAYSGAAYEPDKQDDDEDTLLIYGINELGQRELLNPDLSKGTEDSAGLAESQMEAIVSRINDIFDTGSYVRPAAVWLPPLEERIYAETLTGTDFAANWAVAKPDDPLALTLGLMDIPSKQTQENLVVNLSEDGHLAFFGSSGYGKSTALQNVMMSAARTHTPDTLQMYVFDFGTNGLAPLRNLPHVKGFYGIDEENEIRDWLADIQEVMDERKEKLADQLVSNTEMYYRKTGEKMADVLIVIDAYEAKRQEKWDSDFDQTLLTILRSGNAIGLHVVMNASRSNDVRSNLASGFKDRFMLFMNDDSDKSAILGRTTVVVSDLPGRGLIRVNGEVEEVQLALPATGDDDLQVLDAIDAQIKMMNESLGKTAEGDSARPKARAKKQVSADSLLEMPDVQQALAEGKAVLGTADEQQLVYLDTDQQHFVLVLADSKDVVGKLLDSLTVTMKPTMVVSRENLAAFKANTLPRLLDGTLTGQTIAFMPAYDWLEAYDENSISVSIGGLEVERTDMGQLVPEALFETDNRFIVADVRSNFRVDDHLALILDDAATRVYSGPWDKRLFMEADEPMKPLHSNEFYAQVDGEVSILKRVKAAKKN